MDERRDGFLPEDNYDFLGCGVGVRSNSGQILGHLRSMYGRFYRGNLQLSQGKEKKDGVIPRVRTDIISDHNRAPELSINDGFFHYEISGDGGRCFFTRLNLQNNTPDLSGYGDPVSLLQAALLETVAFANRNYYFLHAGVVAWKDAGIILAGDSGSGKTTLVVNLILHGFRFLSDEAACISRDLDTIEPFPRKLNLRQGSLALLGLSFDSERIVDFMETDEPVHMIDVEEIVPSCLSQTCRAQCILFLGGYGEEPRLEPICSSNALFALPRFLIAEIEDPAFLLFSFAKLLNEVKCYNLIIGEPDATVAEIMRLVKREL